MSVVMSEHKAELADSYAVDALLSDVDDYTEWLGGQCFGKSVHLGYVPRDPVELSDRITAASVPELVALTLYPRSQVAAAACHELRTRYINARSDWISQRAAEIAPEIQE